MTAVTLSTGFGLPALLLVLLGLLLSIVALLRLRRLRLLAACGHGVTAAALLAGGVALFALGMNIHTYQRLTLERPVAEVEFTQSGTRHFTARIHLPDTGQYHDVTLHGDEWQMDARVLKWRGPAVLAGLDTRFRLERISGRYQDIQSERDQPRSAHELAGNPGLDIWRLGRRHERYLPWMDARYGSATYLPMRDGARYEVSMTQTGLIARPANTPAQQAVADWN